MLLFISGTSDFKPNQLLAFMEGNIFFCKLKDSVSFAILYVVFPCSLALTVDPS